MANVQIGRRGFAQVERNHMSGEVTGQILAQLPVDTTTMGKIIENGRFAKYDYAKGKVNLTGPGEWMMIYNEEKLYDERKQSHKDFAMIASNYTDGEIVPRLISTVLGDVFTTNAFGISTGANSDLTSAITVDNFDVAGVTLDDTAIETTTFAIDKTTGYLDIVGGAADANLDKNGPIFQLVKIYTMADGQPGVKLMRIK